MVSVFDREKLEGLLKDFYAISHIRITVFDEDRNELVSYPREVAPACRVIRGTATGLDACMRCDREACERAARKRGTEIYRCHAGLTEAVKPLYVGDVLVGYLLFGHVFSYPDHETGWQEIRRCCAQLPVDEGRLQEAVFQAEPVEEDYIRSAARILHAVASYLILERMAVLREDALAARLDEYVSAHFTQPLNAEKMCAALGIGKTQLYKLSAQLYGCGIAQHIRKLRMTLAKKLLAEREDLSLAEIGDRCGYADYNYFINVFSREESCPPGAWRNREHASSGVHAEQENG